MKSIIECKDSKWIIEEWVIGKEVRSAPAIIEEWIIKEWIVVMSYSKADSYGRIIIGIKSSVIWIRPVINIIIGIIGVVIIAVGSILIRI
jgi:hypothetical protein